MFDYFLKYIEIFTGDSLPEPKVNSIDHINNPPMKLDNFFCSFFFPESIN